MRGGWSERAIAASLGLGKGTVGACLRRARKAGPTWPLPDALSHDDLEMLLFPAAPSVPDGKRPVPDWSFVGRELRRPGVTRALLWQEYRAAHPLGFGYAWPCEHCETWKGRVRPTSHQRCAFSATRRTHVGGEKVFVDFAGDMIDVIDPTTADARPMKVFVAASRWMRAFGTTGASNYTYAEAVASEGLEDRICSHVRMFAFLGGVPRVVGPPLGRLLRNRLPGRGQPEIGGVQCGSLRPGPEPDLCREGRPLRHRHPARASRQAA